MNNRKSLHLLAEAYKQVVETQIQNLIDNEGISWQEAEYFYASQADSEFEKDYTFSVWGKELCDELESDYKLNILRGAQMKRDGEANATITITLGPRTLGPAKDTLKMLNDKVKETERNIPIHGVIIANDKPDNADSVRQKFDAEAKANGAARVTNNRR